MNDKIRQSIQEVAEAMAHVNRAFQDYVQELNTLSKDPSEIETIVKNADTLKDSGHIYMSGTRHYAGIGGDEGPTEDIDEDEGRIADF
jgi:hypothetical protein